MTTYTPYPRLDSIIDESLIPNDFIFFTNSLKQLLSAFYIKQLITNQQNESSWISKFSLRMHEKLGFELFGTGIEIIVNPDYDPIHQKYFSEIDGQLGFQCKHPLKYILPCPCMYAFFAA